MFGFDGFVDGYEELKKKFPEIAPDKKKEKEFSDQIKALPFDEGIHDLVGKGLREIERTLKEGAKKGPAKKVAGAAKDMTDAAIKLIQDIYARIIAMLPPEQKAAFDLLKPFDFSKEFFKNVKDSSSQIKKEPKEFWEALMTQLAKNPAAKKVMDGAKKIKDGINKKGKETKKIAKTWEKNGRKVTEEATKKAMEVANKIFGSKKNKTM